MFIINFFFFSFFNTAKKVICRKNSSSSNFGTLSNGASPNHISSSSSTFLRRGNSFQADNDDGRFLTRTRLRPGGPPPSRRYHSNDPQAVYGTPVMTSNRRMFNGEETDFTREMFPVSAAFYGTMGGCATPLVKQRVANGRGQRDDGFARVQMFRTRVVYSDNREGNVIQSQEASV